MLENIQNTLVAIGDFFTGIGQFISDFVQDLIVFVQNLTSVSDQMSVLFGSLPTYFISGLVVLITIMVLLRVLGRD